MHFGDRPKGRSERRGQIPKFDPNVTDLRIYEQKMRFLHAMWPADHIEHLAPRAALLIEGSAFQKVARLDPAKLRTKQGVQFLIESLGGQWGKLSTEEKYELFERALYTVVQRPTKATIATWHAMTWRSRIWRPRTSQSRTFVPTYWFDSPP